tara:strand:+ start:60679 stop:62589 length:1911 start_codon:yes stop_codon:yes gene_type:complete
MNSKSTIFLVFILFQFLSASAVWSQTSDFQQANRLMQQQNYEEALPILEVLYENNPGSLLFFDQYIDCLVNLTRYEKAEQIVRNQIQEGRYISQASIKLAEILHISGKSDEAMEIWIAAVKEDQDNIQTYYAIGNSMLRRQEFDAAIELYKQGQSRFNNSGLFTNELADTYMQAGRFEEAVNEYYRLIIDSPDQMGIVQQRFFMMRDPNVYEIAALELEDLLLEMHFTESSYSSLYQLLAWLLLETDQYQRAFQFARYYENQTSFTIYSLFSLASQFLSAKEFELAVQAYEYYLNDSVLSIRSRSGEELSATYIQWAQYLQQNNIGSFNRYRELNQKAYNLSLEVIENDSLYSRADRIYTQIIDLNIDFFKDLNEAQKWYAKMLKQKDRMDEAYLYYVEGRLAIFQKEFTTARHSLTRADQHSGNSNLSERSRYYLSLSDFFAKDYEFAEIQLQSLERRSSSFYANDAIKLRMWIKNGLRADTTRSLINSISESMHQLDSGNYNSALDLLEPVLSNSQNPFAADLLTELISVLPEKYYPQLLQISERIIDAQPNSPKKERLYWDRAILVENLLLNDELLNFTPYNFSFLEENLQLQYNREDLYELYEDIIMEFPNGFYAVYAREKLLEFESYTTHI